MSAPPLMIVSGSSRVRTAAPLNHALYAGSVGIPYFFDVAPTRVDRIYFHKLEVIRAYLPLAEWLFWIDDDAFFTDFAADARSFVDDKSSSVLIENLQQAVDVHEGQLIDRQEIARSRPVHRPTIHVDIE